jgi:putative acetyltransferase
MEVRRERPADVPGLDTVHLGAFPPGHNEVVVGLVRALRARFLPDRGLSLVAHSGGEVVGHALFTRAVVDAPARQVEVQVLSPLAVVPAHQRRGVGTLLVRTGLDLLAGRGVPLVFLEGDPRYYSRLGFVQAGERGFGKPSPRIPDAGFQVAELPGAQDWMKGALVYPDVFWDLDLVGLRDS